MLSSSFKRSLCLQPRWIQYTRSKTTTSSNTTPPTYFSEHLNSGPQPIFDGSSPPSSPIPQAPLSYSSQSPSSSSQSSSSSSSRYTTIRDLSLVFSIITLAYFAVDNYKERIALENKSRDDKLRQMKALTITQHNFNLQRKKRETQILNERRNAQKREMKMVYHISMLRKQLIDAGLKPAEIDEAISEFEKNVKMENSISNVSGTALWVIDESPMKAYVPNIHDYDTKK